MIAWLGTDRLNIDRLETDRSDKLGLNANASDSDSDTDPEATGAALTDNAARLSGAAKAKKAIQGIMPVRRLEEEQRRGNRMVGPKL